MATRKIIQITLPEIDNGPDLPGRPPQVIDVTVRTSTIEDSSLHEVLIMEGDAIILDGSRKTFNRKNIATFVFPHCVACIESPEDLREITLDQFLALDEKDIDRLAAASQELNSHWWDRQTSYMRTLREKIEEMSAEAQKKTGMPLTGSQNSTIQTKKTARSRRSRNLDSKK